MKTFTFFIALSILCSCTLTAQILFQDDFSGNLSNWEIVTGTWSIVDGKLRGIADDLDGAYIYAGDTMWTDYEMSVNVAFPRGANIVLRSREHWQNEYEITIFNHHSWDSRVEYQYWLGGEWLFGGWVGYLKPIPDIAIIKVQVIGERFAVYVNNKFVCGDENAPNLPHGRIGLGTWWSEIMFDEVVVRALGPMASIPRLSSDSIAFGDVYPCYTNERNLIIHNDGTEPLTWDTLYCDNSDITFENTCGIILPGDSCAVMLRYKSSTLGTTGGNGVIAFHENCAFANFKISANVIRSVSLRPDSVIFGDVLLCSSETQTLNIHNNGTDTLNIDTIHCNNNDFMFETNSSSIPPGDSSLITIHYHPTACGTIVSNGIILFNNNCESLHFYLSSNVIHRLALHPDSIAFGDVFLGTANTRYTTIYNNRTDILTIDTLSSSHADITLESECETILPGDSCVVAIQYNPTSYGFMEGNGLITFNEYCEFANFKVSGNVVHDPYQNGSWSLLGLEGRSIGDIACGNNAIFVVTADSGNVYRSQDEGITWFRVFQGGADKIAFSRTGTLFVSSQLSLHRSTDDGIFWVTAFDMNQTEHDAYFGNFDISPSGIILIGGDYYFLHWHYYYSYRSSDNGITWDASSGGIINAFLSDQIVVGIRGSWVTSTDGGISWYSHSSNMTSAGTLTFNASGRVFAGNGDGLFVSADLCTTWTKISELVPNKILAISDSTIIISTNGQGIFISTDAGDSWLTFNTGLTNLNVHTLARDSLGYVYAGTDSGVFKVSVSQIVGIQELTTPVPRVYGLEQNYPNPFNPVTMITIDLPFPSIVTLKVYNLIGQEVATLFNGEEFDAGTEEVEFDGSVSTSGVYFYRFTAQAIDENGVLAGNRYAKTMKMMLVK